MTTGDGQAGFKGESITGTLLDTTVVFKGTALPVGAANKVLQNGFFLLLDSLTAPTIKTWYIQTSATVSSPNFVEIPSTLVGQAGDQLYPLNTTIGDYTTPSAAVGTSEATGSPSDTDAIGGTTDINFDATVVRFSERFNDTLLRNRILNTVKIQMKKTLNPTGNLTVRIRKTSDDSIVGTADSTLDVSTLTGSYAEQSFTFTGVSTPNEDFRVTAEYGGADGSNYATLGRSTSSVYANGIGGFYDGSWDETTAQPFDIDFIITTTPDFQDGSANDDNVLSSWKSISENNPAIYLDMGSNKELASIAIHLDRTNTTVTEFEISYSTDTTFSGEVVRTLLVSDFTDDTWRFISIPRQDDDRRYFQIRATDNSVVFAINEIKYKAVTDWDRKHYHKYLDPASTSANSEDSN